MPSFFIMFLCYIVLEIYVLVQASASLGGWTVLMLLAAGFFAGALILQHNRARILSGRPGKIPGLIFSSLAAVLFIIPGFVSDALGILLLLPPFQARMGLATNNFFKRQGFNRLFRFRYFNGMDFSNFGEGQSSGPDFREDVKVTVIDTEGRQSAEQTVSRRKRIDSDNIIDVEIDEKPKE